jgi:transcriptional regulator with XRE-family HTH domain
MNEGQKLRKMREATGLSLAKTYGRYVAMWGEDLEVSESKITRAERQATPDADLAMRLAILYGRSPEDVSERVKKAADRLADLLTSSSSWTMLHADRAA